MKTCLSRGKIASGFLLMLQRILRLEILLRVKPFPLQVTELFTQSVRWESSRRCNGFEV